MALIRTYTLVTKDSRVHEEVECGYLTFHEDGRTYLQLDTYGTRDRKIPGKVSQSIQLDAESASELVRLIRTAFPGV